MYGEKNTKLNNSKNIYKL